MISVHIFINIFLIEYIIQFPALKYDVKEKWFELPQFGSYKKSNKIWNPILKWELLQKKDFSYENAYLFTVALWTCKHQLPQ